MTGYSPSPDDLDDPPMPDEWRRVADAVFPNNRELAVELVFDTRSVIRRRYGDAAAGPSGPIRPL